MTNDPIEVTVLASCPDNNTCPQLVDAGHPEFLHFVASEETDPRIRAALAARIGAGERLMRWPRSIGLPEVAPR